MPHSARFPSCLDAMVNTLADKLLLLLSTDWFAPYWPSLGLFLPRAAKANAQSALRAEVRQAFEGSTYWNTSFEPARVARTRAALTRAFSKHERAAAVIGSLLERSAVSDTVSESWLLSSMTELLVNSGVDEVSGEVIELARAAWHTATVGSMDWSDLCVRSDSDWDRTIKALTPDLPSWLGDFVAIDLQCVDSFGLFWSEVRDTLTLDQRNELRHWYERTALDLTGQAVQFDFLE